MNNKFLLPTLLAAAATSAWAVDPAPSPKEDKRVAAATTGEDVGISARDGITVSGADVMVTRNGRTEKLEAPLTLDGGTRINPDGTVKLADGRNITLRAEQRLTFDGRLLNSPIVETPATAVVGAATNTTTVTVDPRTGLRSFIFVDPATGRRLNVSRNADGQVIYRDVETGGVFTAATNDPRSGLPIFTDPRSGVGMTVGVDPRTGQPIYTNSATGAAMTYPNNGTNNGTAGNVNGTTTNGAATTGTLNGTNTGTVNGTNTGTLNGTNTGTGTLNGTTTGTNNNGTGTTTGTRNGTTTGTGTSTTRSGTGTTGGTTSGTTGGTRSGTSGTTGTSGGGAGSPGTSGGTSGGAAR